MMEVTIKFRDRNRSDLKIKVKGYYDSSRMVCFELDTKEGVRVTKEFPTDIIDEIMIIERYENQAEKS